MNKTTIFILIIILVLVGAGAVFIFLNEPEQVFCTQEAKLCPDGSYVGRVGPDCEFSPCPAQKNIDLKKGAYEIEGQLVILENSSSTRYFGNETKGDFNGDGLEDVAFLLTQDSGGSGTFFYVAVALRESDGFRGINAVFLGDRIAPQTTEFKNGEIVVNYADRQPGEPMTAIPSVGVSRYFKVNEARLVEIKK